MWQPDGAGWRARVGALTPHLDPVPETELRAMAPQGVSIHAARVPLGTLDRDGNISLQRGAGAALAFAEPPHVDHAAMLLASIPASVIVYAYTSSSYILGVDGDKALKARLEARAPGIPVVIPMPACCLALRAVGARRIALIHPPWFSADVDRSGAEYFQSQRFEVVHHAPAPLRSDFGEVHPGQIYDWARRNVPDSAEAVVIGGNGLRAIGAIKALEEDLGRLVLSANQVVFWHALHLAGVHATVNHYGRIFTADLPPEA
jgi:maleate isomerase